MNVVRGGQSMFMKKDLQKPVGQQIGWGTWVWNNVVGEKENSNAGSNSGVVIGGGQSNIVVRALKGLSETVFGF